MSEFTPGPWKVGQVGCFLHVTTTIPGNPIICDLHYNSEANARLIAAAPDLLAALMAVIEDLEHKEPDGWMSGQVHVSAFDKARAAIAKAEGK